MSRLLNKFLVGADPELCFFSTPTVVNAMEEAQKASQHVPVAAFGYDHNGFVLEPHPTPDYSVRRVVRNIRASLKSIYDSHEEYPWLAGAYVDGRNRKVTLGGHVHIDLPTLSKTQIAAMDAINDSFVHLDLLPKAHCAMRKQHGYGGNSDIRAEHGHVEYRSLCSWLFSRKTSMLCMTAIKLAACAPDSVKPLQSMEGLRAWLELFKAKDDDVDWILDKDYFGKSMVAKPEADVKSVWRLV